MAAQCCCGSEAVRDSEIQLEAAVVHMLSFSSAVMVVDILFDEARQRWFGGTEEILIEVMLRFDLAVRKEIYGWSGRGGGQLV